MSDGGPYSLLTLAFVVFSFVSWQVRGGNPWQLRRGNPGQARPGHPVALALGFCAAFLMLLVAFRLAVWQVAHLVGQVARRGSMSPESPDLFLASFDVLLISLFFLLLAWTAAHVLTLVATTDPTPK